MNRELPHQPVVRTLPLIRSLVAIAMATLLAVASLWSARADDLDEQKEELKRQLAAQAGVVEDAHVSRDNAVAAAAQARSDLAAAEVALAKAEADLVAAEELDQRRAEELKLAEEALALAKAEVEMARAALEAANKRVNEEILVTTQSTAGLSNLAMIFTDVNVSNLNQRAQLATTLFDSSSRQLDELERLRIELEDAEAKAAEVEAKAKEAREAAAAQLTATQEAKAAADRLRTEVAELVAARDAAEEAAKNTVVAAENRQAELQAESDAVEARIQERIAAEKRAAEEAARQAAAASRSSSGSASSGSTGSGTSVPFQLPAGSNLTSPYGMRLHPILGYYRMHDGTDFGASCGTPLLAAADGTVAEKYYSSGYGNRLMIDHGRVNGTYVTTGYNHATHYVVNVGQRVSRGQVIGYVGTTGMSTGCHLHLMAWENGVKTNPMRWF